MSEHPESVNARAIARVVGDPLQTMHVVARGELLRAAEGAGNSGIPMNVGQIAQIVAVKG
jgi:hypothetical protein